MRDKAGREGLDASGSPSMQKHAPMATVRKTPYENTALASPFASLIVISPEEELGFVIRAPRTLAIVMLLHEASSRHAERVDPGCLFGVYMLGFPYSDVDL